MKLVQIPSFMFIGTMDIEFKEKKKNNMDKIMVSFHMKRKWCFREIFHTQFGFNIFYAVKSSEVELT